MAEYAPAAILDLFAHVAGAVPSAQLGGVIGDVSHVYGYHRARNVLPFSDYSIQLDADRDGDGWAASALDITLDPARMRLVTGRLLASAQDRDDPRLDVCREFYGTLDGRTVAGWDTFHGQPATSDDSHLWHVHISFLRRYATDPDAMDAVYSVIVGETTAQWRAANPTGTAGGPDVNLGDRITTYTNGQKTIEDVLKDVYDGVFNKVPDLRKQLEQVRADVAGLRAEVHQLAAGQHAPTVDTAALTAAVQHAVTDAFADTIEAFVAELVRRATQGKAA